MHAGKVPCAQSSLVRLVAQSSLVKMTGVNADCPATPKVQDPVTQ